MITYSRIIQVITHGTTVSTSAASYCEVIMLTLQNEEIYQVHVIDGFMW